MDEIENRARGLLESMLQAPYGENCTIGHVVCAETTRSRLEAAWLPLIAAALRSAQVPDGWVLVPRDPTDEMYAAAVERIKQNTVIIDAGPAKGATLVRDRPGHLWAAMLAAAPSAEGV